MGKSTLDAPFIIPIRNPFCGKLKKHVDTNTPIEIQCNLSKASVYYTLDNSKPNPFKKLLNSSHGTTQKFSKPFYLNPGKQTIKAIAVTDSQESSIVTKIFYVEYVNPPVIENIKDLTYAKKRRKSESSASELVATDQDLAQSNLKFSKPRAQSAVLISSAEKNDDVDRCPYCLTSKPIDSFVPFCYRCGAKLFCSDRDSAVYKSLKSSSVSAKDYEHEPHFISKNSSDCAFAKIDWEMMVKDNGCTVCGRNNCRDSRFCDSCGSRLNSRCLICECEQNPIHAKFCLKCGTSLMLEAEKSEEEEEEMKQNQLIKPESKSESTQTNGIFFPSSKELSSKSKDSSVLHKQKSLPSPGNGYWRQQVDHITAHLKAYAYNNMDFRNSIKDPKVGNLLYARVKEMESGSINVVMSFTYDSS